MDPRSNYFFLPFSSTGLAGTSDCGGNVWPQAATPHGDLD
jgi:hypothetical protein